MSKSQDKKDLSVFLVESMDADDVYKGLLEGEALVQILKLLGVKATYRTVVDKKRLKKAMQEASEEDYSVFHLSCHANKKGFALTLDDDFSWQDLAEMADDLLNGSILCLSACEAGNTAVADEFEENDTKPTYIIGPESKPGYAQTCVGWSVFYHYLAKKGISKNTMQQAMKRMNEAVDSDFLYRRWNGRKYLRYPPMKTKRSVKKSCKGGI